MFFEPNSAPVLPFFLFNSYYLVFRLDLIVIFYGHNQSNVVIVNVSWVHRFVNAFKFMFKRCNNRVSRFKWRYFVLLVILVLTNIWFVFFGFSKRRMFLVFMVFNGVLDYMTEVFRSLLFFVIVGDFCFINRFCKLS
jgi:hypothetical protein